jgi:hypothetical protein
VAAGLPPIEMWSNVQQDDLTAALIAGESADSPVTGLRSRPVGALEPASEVFDSAPYGWPLANGSALAESLWRPENRCCPICLRITMAVWPCRQVSFGRPGSTARRRFGARPANDADFLAGHFDLYASEQRWCPKQESMPTRRGTLYIRASSTSSSRGDRYCPPAISPTCACLSRADISRGEVQPDA